MRLIRLPPELQANIERRRPAPGRFQDLTGEKFESCEVLGFAGFIGRFSAWLCRCKCGNLFLSRGPHLKHTGGQTCGCARPKAKPKKPPAIVGKQIRARNKSKNIAQWAKARGISKQAMHVRVKKAEAIGLDPEVAVNLLPREQIKNHVPADTRHIANQVRALANEPLRG